jgi:membrane protease YdiL (CAAX protease family)
MHSKMSMDARKLALFLAIVFAGGFALQGLAIHAGVSGPGSPWLLATMWMPALAALAVDRKAVRAALRRPRVAAVGIALVAGWGAILLQSAAFAAGLGSWNAKNFEPDGLGGIRAVHHVGMALGVGAQGPAFFAVNLLLSVALGSLVTALIGGIGEEIGWRGWLQPALEKRFGVLGGTLAVGLIWSAWHLPANLAGYNDPVHPVWTALVFFPIGVTSMAFLFAWLAKRHGVWAAAIAHGANNTISSAFLYEAHGWKADTLTLTAALVILGALAAVSLARNPYGVSQSTVASPQPLQVTSIP